MRNILSLLLAGVALAAAAQSVAPLSLAVRHQRAPFNDLSPVWRDTGERCLSGCVATAMETALSLTGRTLTLRDTLHAWPSDHYDLLPAPAGEQVDCSLIRWQYAPGAYSPAEAEAVARLTYWLGLCCHMNWGPRESGANLRTAVEPLRQAVGLGYVHHIDSYRYTPQRWRSILENELRHGRAVVYAAYTQDMSGHCFVLDGLDPQGNVHANWGYGGNYDGFFPLQVLNFAEPLSDRTPQGDQEGFLANAEALLLHPDSAALDAQTRQLLADTLVRTGRELCVDSVCLPLKPETGKHTPIHLYLRNTTATALTTPLEVFTCTAAQADSARQGLLPSDSLLAHSDFVGLTGCTLQPGEQTCLTLHATFHELGERLLRLSPDDSTWLFTLPLMVEQGQAAPLRCQEPQLLSLTPDGTASFATVVENPSPTGRSGQRVIYEVIPALQNGSGGSGSGEAEGSGAGSDGKGVQPATEPEGTRHVVRHYLEPGTSATDTVRFHALAAGETYTLLVRNPWTVAHRLNFTMPAPAGMEAVTRSTVQTSDQQSPWVDLSGRPVTRRHHGVVVRRGEKAVRK